MKSERTKSLILSIQRHQAQYDVAIGKPPRKSSKTYINQYAKCYAEQEILTGRNLDIYL
jgi:hypothetical protein